MRFLDCLCFSVQPARWIGLAALGAALLAAPAAHAADLIVVDGGCTLSDAITAANTDAPVGRCPAGAGADTIVVSLPLTLSEIIDTTGGPNALPSITSEITVDGSGLWWQTELTPSGPFRLFHIAAAGRLTLKNVSVSGLAALDPFPDGGALYVDGGQLTLDSVTLMNASATQGRGGVIYNQGGTVTIRNSALRGLSDEGGALYNNGGVVSVVNSEIPGEPASISGLGAAIYSTAGSAVTVEHSELGGLHNAGTLSIRHSVVLGRSNAGAHIVNLPSGMLDLDYVTLYALAAWNSTLPLLQNQGSAALSRSILYHPLADECSGGGSFSGGDNLGRTGQCPGVIDIIPADAPIVQPGGAVSFAAYASDRLGSCNQRDIRYFPRDSQCDIGAHEETGSAIMGRVWEDFDGSGNRRLTRGLEGVTLRLIDAAGTTLAQAVSVQNGVYWFAGLAPGTYRVGITLPDGFSLTRQNDANAGEWNDSDASPATGLTDPVTVTSGGGPLTRFSDFGVFRYVTLEGWLFEDANGNGQYDPGETPLPGIQVMAARQGTWPGTEYAYTNAAGRYRFNRIAPGLYEVSFAYAGASGAAEAAAALAEVEGTARRRYRVFVRGDDHGQMRVSFGLGSAARARPERGLITGTNTPTLSWSALSWAAGYEVQVDDDRSFGSLDFHAALGPGDLEVATTALNAGRYYWRVRARRADQTWGGWSAVQSFIMR